MEDHSLEQGFEKLDEIINKMSSREISLEDSFKLYSDGIEELKYCAEKISDTEKKVYELQSDGNLKIFCEE